MIIARTRALTGVLSVLLASCSAQVPLMNTLQKSRATFEYETVRGSVLLPGGGRPVGPSGDGSSHTSGTVAGALYFTSRSGDLPDFTIGVSVDRRPTPGSTALSIAEFAKERDELRELTSRERGFKTPGNALDPATIQSVDLGGRSWFLESGTAPAALYYVCVVNERYMVVVRGYFSTVPGKSMDQLRAANAQVLRAVAESLEIVP